MSHRGLPADTDTWKTRSDRDDQPEDPDMQNDIASEIENALNHDLKSDFPNAPRLGLKPVTGNSQNTPATSRDRIQNTIGELEHLVADLNTLIATLQTIRSKL
jgi:hypothetical protein